MNNDNTTQTNETTTPKVPKFIVYALCFLLAFAIMLGVKSCTQSLSIPDEFKPAETLLKKEGFSCKYLGDEDDFEELFEVLDLDTRGVNEVFGAFDEDTDDFFLIICCDDVQTAKDVEYDLACDLVTDNYLYYRGYTTKVDYKTVYFGHRDLISAILK